MDEPDSAEEGRRLQAKLLDELHDGLTILQLADRLLWHIAALLIVDVPFALLDDAIHRGYPVWEAAELATSPLPADEEVSPRGPY